ncbi:hypothetical protein GCM10022293_48120 [Azospirillum formosense]
MPSHTPHGPPRQLGGQQVDGAEADADFNKRHGEAILGENLALEEIRDTLTASPLVAWAGSVRWPEAAPRLVKSI